MFERPLEETNVARTTNALWAALLVASAPATAALLRSAPPPSAPTDTTSAASTTTVQAPPRQTARTLLGEQLGREVAPDGRRLGLIVTLPDPVSSRFALTFDNQFAALQRAVEVAGYSLDRFALPWQKGKHAGQGVPGVLLYRARQFADPPLLVWIVGETPTIGIDKVAFAEALTQWTQVIGPFDTARAVPVLGPSFSGAAPSLATAITNVPEPRPPFRIISGSATAIPINRASRRYEIAGLPFQSTVPRDEDALRAFMNYLCAQDIEPDSVVLLTEANTAYGQAANAFNTPCDRQLGAGQRSVLSVPFPMHVAHLREHFNVREPDAPATPRQASRSRLPADTAAATVDVAAPYAPADATAEVQLSSSLQAIADAHARYVGIFATDVLDTIMLARAVREHAPNATLFTLNNELLYVHGEANPALIGMLVVSAYPLAPVNRTLTFPFRVDAGPPSPPTDRAVGVYNATLALLHRTDLMSEYAPALADRRTRPPHWLTIVGRGALWPLQPLSSLTSDYMFNADPEGPPVISAATKTDRSVGVAERRTASVGLPHVYYPLFCTWCLGVLCLIYAMGATPRGFDGNCGRLRLLTGRPGFARYFYILTALLVLAAIQLLSTVLLAMPFLLWLRHGLIPELHWTWGMAVAILAAASLMVVVAVIIPTAIAFALRGLWATRRQARHFRLTFAILSVASMNVTVMTILLGRQWLSLAPVEQLLLVTRASSLASGVSPMAPLVCVAAAALCATSAALRRLSLLDEAIAPSSHGGSFTTLDEGEAEIQRTFSREMVDMPGFVPILILLSVPCMGLFLTGFAPPAEASWFHTLFEIGFAVVYLGLAMEAARFVYGWWALRGHLRRLAWHPTGDEFASIRKAQPAPPAVQLTGTSHAMTALAFLASYAQAFAATMRRTPEQTPSGERLAELSVSTLGALVTQAEQELRAAAHSDATYHMPGTIGGRRDAGRLLDEVCRMVAEAMPIDRAQVADRGPLAAAAASLFKARSVVIVHQTIRQLQSVVSFVTLGLLLMLMAVSVYPFQPHGWLLSFNWFVMGTTIAAALVVFVQMDRDKVLSELTATIPGRVTLDRDFWLRLFFFVLVPMLSLLGTQFPESYRQLFNLLGAPKPF